VRGGLVVDGGVVAGAVVVDGATAGACPFTCFA
jgi:hypothetical protein